MHTTQVFLPSKWVIRYVVWHTTKFSFGKICHETCCVAHDKLFLSNVCRVPHDTVVCILVETLKCVSQLLTKKNQHKTDYFWQRKTNIKQTLVTISKVLLLIYSNKCLHPIAFSALLFWINYFRVVFDKCSWYPYIDFMTM